MTLMQQMRRHSRCSSLAMSTSHTKSLVFLSEQTQHLSPLLYVKSVLLEINQFSMFSRNSRSIDHESIFLYLETGRNLLHIILIMYLRTFFNQLLGKLTRSLIITAHIQPFGKIISYQGTHADTSSTYKINTFHNHFFNLYTSSAILSAELCKASFSTFSDKDFNFFSSDAVRIAISTNVSRASLSATNMAASLFDSA